MCAADGRLAAQGRVRRRPRVEGAHEHDGRIEPGARPGRRPQGAHQPPGAPRLRQPEPAHGRRPRPRHAGELPVPGEDQPLRPRAHPRACGARPRGHGVRLFRGVRHLGRRTHRPLHPGQAVPGAGQAHRPRRPLLHRHRRAGLRRDRPRPARLRGEVLHRGRQLGPRRQQPRRLLHPRRDQVPRRHPRAQAGPGHLPAAAPAHLRLHVADARVHAHAGQPVQPARHPGGLPSPAGLRRQHLQVGQRGGRDQARQVPLDAQAGRPQHDRGGRRQRPGPRPRPRHQGPLRRRDPRRLPGVGTARPDDGRPRPPGAGLRPARRHQDLARAGVPGEAGRPDGPRPDAGELLRRERADLLRHRRPGRRARLLRRQDAGRPHLLVQRHPALPGGPQLPPAARQPGQERRGAHQPARRTDGLPPGRRRREPHRQLRAVHHRRPARGRVPDPRRAGPGDPGAPHPQAASRAPTTTCRPGSATC